MTFFKDILVTRTAKPDRREEHQDHIIRGHSRLVMSTSAFDGVFERFTMNRVLADSDETEATTLYRRDPEALVVVEHQCVSHEAFAAASRDPEYLARVKPDEQYMASEVLSGPPVAYDIRQDQIVFSDVATGPYVIFDFLARPAPVSPVEFAKALRREGETLSADSEYRAAVSKRVHDLVGTTPSLYAVDGVEHDAVVETWVRDFTVLRPLLDRLRVLQRGYVDPDSSFSVITFQTVVV
jgi:hypothetical protein